MQGLGCHGEEAVPPSAGDRVLNGLRMGVRGMILVLLCGGWIWRNNNSVV